MKFFRMYVYPDCIRYYDEEGVLLYVAGSLTADKMLKSMLINRGHIVEAYKKEETFHDSID